MFHSMTMAAYFLDGLEGQWQLARGPFIWRQPISAPVLALHAHYQCIDSVAVRQTPQVSPALIAGQVHNELAAPEHESQYSAHYRPFSLYPVRACIGVSVIDELVTVVDRMLVYARDVPVAGMRIDMDVDPPTYEAVDKFTHSCFGVSGDQTQAHLARGTAFDADDLDPAMVLSAGFSSSASCVYSPVLSHPFHRSLEGVLRTYPRLPIG